MHIHTCNVSFLLELLKNGPQYTHLPEWDICHRKHWWHSQHTKGSRGAAKLVKWPVLGWITVTEYQMCVHTHTLPPSNHTQYTFYRAPLLSMSVHSCCTYPASPDSAMAARSASQQTGVAVLPLCQVSRHSRKAASLALLALPGWLSLAVVTIALEMPRKVHTASQVLKAGDCVIIDRSSMPGLSILLRQFPEVNSERH